MQRKVFRIEKLFAERRAAASPLRAHANVPTTARESTDNAHDLKAELARLNDSLAHTKSELGALIGNGNERRMARAADELRASVDGMDHATQKILNAVELIDDGAKALTASLKDEYKRGLAQDIQDQVVQIFEASNFQDLAGQRISNAIAIMTMVEDRIAAIMERCHGAAVAPASLIPTAGRDLINGPKLDGDPGHADQRDIDKMFG